MLVDTNVLIDVVSNEPQWADFFIGAHAAVSRLPVLTRDTHKYQNYFPTVKLVSLNALH